jgi:hypothetical protein
MCSTMSKAQTRSKLQSGNGSAVISPSIARPLALQAERAGRLMSTKAVSAMGVSDEGQADLEVVPGRFCEREKVARC